MASIRKQASAGGDIITLSRGAIEEHFITLTLGADESPESLFRRVGEAVHQVSGSIVSVEALGLSTADRTYRKDLIHSLDGPDTPFGWVENTLADHLCGVHVWLISGTPVSRLERGGRRVASVFEDDHAHYCRLVGLLPENVSGDLTEQAGAIFGQMEEILQGQGMAFSDVFRTWFYNNNILSWYGDFNAVRNRFFTERKVFDGLVPASTGIGGSNMADAALIAGLIALRPKGPGVKVTRLNSPLQSSARDYGSSFSRAVEVEMPDHRRIYVSGTASIDKAGETVYLGDAEAQVKLTMEVVEAILRSRGMDWSDVTRSLAYFKRAEDVHLLDEYHERNHLPSFPVIVVENDVCRDNLLFEIEVDAVKVK